MWRNSKMRMPNSESKEGSSVEDVAQFSSVGPVLSAICSRQSLHWFQVLSALVARCQVPFCVMLDEMMVDTEPQPGPTQRREFGPIAEEHC